MNQQGDADPWSAAYDDSGLVAHTPDETRYHYPDRDQAARLRSGFGGVMVPRANNDGTSKGFNANIAGTVHVDPGAADGGVVVNLADLRGDRYLEAYRQSRQPHEVFYRLGQSGKVASAGVQVSGERPDMSAVRENSLAPRGAYVVPASSSDGLQLSGGHPVAPVPPMPSYDQVQSQAYPPQPQPQVQPQTHPPVHVVSGPAPAPPAEMPYQPVPPQQYQPAPQPQYQPQAAPDQSFQQMMGAIGQLTHMVNGLMQTRQQPVVPPLESYAPPEPAGTLQTLPSMPQREPERRPGQTLDQARKSFSEDERREGLVLGFETLNLPFVSGPVPERPREEVFFEMPGMGTMSVRYHQVIDAAACVVLVYDTRYEDGNQWLPPERDSEPVQVTMPTKDLSYSCVSVGIQFPLGVFDIVVLVKTSSK